MKSVAQVMGYRSSSTRRSTVDIASVVALTFKLHTEMTYLNQAAANLSETQKKYDSELQKYMTTPLSKLGNVDYPPQLLQGLAATLASQCRTVSVRQKYISQLVAELGTLLDGRSASSKRNECGASAIPEPPPFSGGTNLYKPEPKPYT
jgi:hypothetical protein